MNVKKIAAIVFTVLAAGMAALSGIMKFIGDQHVIESLTKSGSAEYRILLGSMELAFAALFVFPKTMKIGFILLSCYFAGALATELTHGLPLNATMLLVLIWIAAFLRDRSVFFTENPK